MKKVSWHITSNHQKGAALKEYDRTKYYCETDDAWVEIEVPIAKQRTQPSARQVE